jgi:hypothetical protein
MEKRVEAGEFDNALLGEADGETVIMCEDICPHTQRFFFFLFCLSSKYLFYVYWMSFAFCVCQDIWGCGACGSDNPRTASHCVSCAACQLHGEMECKGS